MGKELNVIHVIDVQMVVNVGFIGYGNQAKRLEQYFDSDEIIIKSKFHPTKISDPYNAKNIKDLLSNDCIFITSPNNTHFEYIKYLINNFSGYIFCEKPPVISEDELIFLKKLSHDKKQKIFFNFNFRFSALNSIFKNYLNSEIIGKPIHFNFLATHGFAFKKEYSSSWRSNKKINNNNILDTVAIHYIDFLIFSLGLPHSHSADSHQITKIGTSNDTTHVTLSFSNGITASIFVSYASSYVNEFSFFGTNGYLTIKENILKIFSPRDTFSKTGNFISPPMIKKENFDLEKNYRESLFNSLNYFFNIVKNSNDIPLSYFDSSLASNQIILDYN